MIWKDDGGGGLAVWVCGNAGAAQDCRGEDS